MCNISICKGKIFSFLEGEFGGGEPFPAAAAVLMTVVVVVVVQHLLVGGFFDDDLQGPLKEGSFHEIEIVI